MSVQHTEPELEHETDDVIPVVRLHSLSLLPSTWSGAGAVDAELFEYHRASMTQPRIMKKIRKPCCLELSFQVAAIN
jgi:hypothetical protein